MSALALLPNMGPLEWIIILAIVLLLFGVTRLPRLARSLGKSVNEFKKGLRAGRDEDEDENQESSSDDTQPDD